MADRWLRVLGSALIVACAASACGDDDDGTNGGDGGPAGNAGRGGNGAPGLSCGSFDACGGDVVGSWELDEVCFNGIEDVFADIADAPGCEDFFSLGTITPHGAYTFGDDGTLAIDDAAFSFAVELDLSAECVQGISGSKQAVKLDAATCDSFGEALGGGDSIEKASCSFAGGGCKCSATSAEMPLTGGGTYQVDGEELIMDGDRSPFCVDGDRLTIRTSSSSMQEGMLTFERK